MFVKRNEHGQIEYYYQKVGDDKENVRFEEDEIIELKNTNSKVDPETIWLQKEEKEGKTTRRRAGRRR